MRNCYVYILSDPDTNLPFYVGKGTGRRMYNHEKKVKRGKLPNDNNGYLFNTIKRILSTGQRPLYEQIECPTDIEAFALEAAFIEYFGLDNLCNIVRGGIVVNPHDNPIMSEIVKDKVKTRLSTPEAKELARHYQIIGCANRLGGFANWFVCPTNKWDKQVRREEAKERQEWYKIVRDIRKELNAYYHREAWEANREYRRRMKVKRFRKAMIDKPKMESFNGKPLSSRFKNVCFVKSKNKWLASIKRNGCCVYRKEFKTEQEAALAVEKITRVLIE